MEQLERVRAPQPLSPRMLVDSHCHLDFPDFTAGLERHGRARAQCRRGPYAHDLHAGAQFPGSPRDCRALPRGHLLGRHAPALGGPGARRYHGTARRTGRASARGGNRRGGAGRSLPEEQRRRTSRPFSAGTSRRRGKPACRFVIHARDCDDDAGPRILREGDGERPVRGGARLLYRARRWPKPASSLAFTSRSREF